VKYKQGKNSGEEYRPYRIWCALRYRCTNKNLPGYKDYGGRGITYDPRWNSFETFWKDMKKGYKNNLSIDRIDNNGNYYKENCQWSTPARQNRNQRRTIYIMVDGKKENLRDFCERHGLSFRQTHSRIFRSKWTISDAIKKEKWIDTPAATQFFKQKVKKYWETATPKYKNKCPWCKKTYLTFFPPKKNACCSRNCHSRIWYHQHKEEINKKIRNNRAKLSKQL
jgi:hypothetical protein